MAPDQDMLLLEDPEESFNTERLESQNSADNLRQSMQRYLATKHQHLKKASEQLLSNRPSEFRQSLGLPPYQPPPRPPGGQASLMAEDKNLNLMNAVAPPAGGAATEPPPQLYKSNLAKSHDELLSLSTKENQDEVLHPPAASGGGGASVGGGAGSQPTSQGILRPCDQYPSEPGVLKPSSSVSSNSRPLSALSNGGVFMGNLRPKSEVDESEPDEEITNATTKVREIMNIETLPEGLQF
jgi:hypothetical protein